MNSWIVCQIGARENYAVARALHRRGMLAGLVTDLWISPRSFWRLLGRNESLAGRYEEELRDAVVRAPNARMLTFGAVSKLLRLPVRDKILAENALFQREAAKIIFDGALGAERRVLFSYSYAARDLFREAKRRGWSTVLGQIDPGPGEQKIVDELRARHPEWAGRPGAVPPPHYWEQWREECDLADRILVNSEWSKSLLVKEGVAADKIDVLPLAYEPAEGRSQKWRVASDEWLVKGDEPEGDRGQETKGREDETRGRRKDKKTTGPKDEETGDWGQEPEGQGNERTKRQPKRSGDGAPWRPKGLGDQGTKRLKDQGTKRPKNEGEETGDREQVTGDRRRDAAEVGRWESGKVGKLEVGDIRSEGGAGGQNIDGPKDCRAGDGGQETGDEGDAVASEECRVKSRRSYPEKFTSGRPLRLLFLGQANVRKGIQDVVEAARMLGDGPWRFDVVGRHPAFPGDIPRSVVFHGQVPRSDAASWYDRADVFLLPTHSDGFAITQIEAMARGLPVVATPCCGEVVRDGVNGWIISAGAPDVLADLVRRIVSAPGSLPAMSESARQTSENFTIDRVGDALVRIGESNAWSL